HNGIHRRFVKASIVVDPPSQNRIEHSGNVQKIFIRLQLQIPVSDRLPHGLAGLIANTGSEVDEELAVSVLGPAWTKGISQKVKLCFRKLVLTVVILAVHNAGFIRVKRKSAFPEALVQLL